MTDRRYGVNKYGDGKLYGASDTQEAYQWDVSIDWDGDGTLESNEANLLTGVSIRRGRTRLIGESGNGFQSVSTGSCSVTLRNDDGRFDGWNTSSPLYPNVNYGKDIRVRIRDMNSGIVYPLFYGVIVNIDPSDYGDDAKVNIQASDSFEFLRNTSGRVPTQIAITPDEAIGLILDSVSWPARWGRSLDTTIDTIPYWWASGNKQALSEIDDLALSSLGYFFIDRTGQARFMKRDSVGSSAADYLQELLLKDIGNPQPYEIQRNITRLKVYPRLQAATGPIWELVGNTPSIIDGTANALTIFANYTYDNQDVPAINVLSPVATTDYLVNTLANGTGTDLTASCTVVMTEFGDTAKLVITNNSGSSGYITFLRIRGDAIYQPNVSDVTYPKDTSSVSMPRELLFDLVWQQDVNVAIDLANVLGPHYAGLHPMPNVKIDNRPSLQFAVDLFDIATATLEKIGVTGESFRVGGIEHTTDTQNENCQSVQTRVYLEPYISSGDYMRWDSSSVWDTDTVFGW